MTFSGTQDRPILDAVDQKVLATFKPGKLYALADVKQRCLTYQKLNLGDGFLSVLLKLKKAGKIEVIGSKGRREECPTAYRLKI